MRKTAAPIILTTAPFRTPVITSFLFQRSSWTIGNEGADALIPFCLAMFRAPSTASWDAVDSSTSVKQCANRHSHQLDLGLVLVATSVGLSESPPAFRQICQSLDALSRRFNYRSARSHPAALDTLSRAFRREGVWVLLSVPADTGPQTDWQSPVVLVLGTLHRPGSDYSCSFSSSRHH